MMERKDLVVFTVAALAALGTHEACARGESWVPKPPPPPPVATLTNEARYLEWKWRMDVTDPATGVDKAKAKAKILALSRELEPKEPWNVVKATCFAWLCDNVAIDVSPLDWFPAFSLWNRYDRPMNAVTGRRNGEIDRKYYPEMRARMNKGNSIGRYTVWKDFDHIIPEWDKVLPLGFPGMKSRLRANWKDNVPYYRAELMASEAIDRLLNRLIVQGRARGGARAIRQAESLTRLRDGAPQTAYDVMQFIYLYFVLSEHFEAVQARSLSIIDQTLWPYYQADLAAGRTTEAEFREQFAHFLWQWGSIDNYWGQPVTMGGTKADGTTEYNPLSLIMLDVADREGLPSPKLQLKMASNTPDAIWRKALEMERRHRSMVMLGEKGLTRSMHKLGLSADECRRLIVWGCFEWLPPEGNCTSACNINLAKPVELMLRDAKDGKLEQPATFEDFKREYYRRLWEVTDLTRKVMDYLESNIADVNPALVLTLGVDSALEKGEDAFSTGMRYNHTTLSETAFATAVDSLVAVKEIVYDRREMSLRELGEVMAANWKGREDLRLRMLRSHTKWGCGWEPTDLLGREVLEKFTGHFVGTPNARGGKYVCYGLNARGYINAGRATGATPDGRKAGEEVSKNMAPSIGGDAEGITGVWKSWKTTVDPAFFPCGLVLDAMMHASSVSGEKGLVTLRALCEEFFENGGCGLNLNIQSVEELKDAQLHPEKYENLQVRVAGWNIRWNDIPKKEQDGFIRRLEAMPR